MVRVRLGYESNFVEDNLVHDMLCEHIDLLEHEAKLDADWCFKDDKQQRVWSCVSPFNSHTYVQECRDAWAHLWKARRTLDEKKRYMSVKPNHTLSGVPFHLSSNDVKEIRALLLQSPQVKEYLDVLSDDICFFVVVKTVPMPALVGSTWVIIGAQLPVAADTIAEVCEEQKARLLENPEDSGSSDGADPKVKKPKKKVARRLKSGGK